MPTVLKPPVNATPQTVAAPAPAPPQPTWKRMCTAEFDPKDQSLLVEFRISPEMAKRFARLASDSRRDLASFLWETRGLRHFENQSLI